jgi:asparagine synthase (glutamine-hydrolysing)
MCGITGILDMAGRGRVDQQVLSCMLNALAHRGPDDNGTYFGANLGLGFTRLSIVDLQGGHQPMTNEDDTIVAVCNGEIYNYRELRTELTGKGHKFKTRSDSEVVLHLYEEYGMAFVEHLNGQFSFVLYDEKTQILFAARDHFGIVPLFYAIVDGLLVFGSEIKAILCHPLVPRDVDLFALDQVFSLTGTVSPRTMFKHVKSLPGGHYFQAGSTGMRIRQYWDLIYPQEKDVVYTGNELYYIEQLDQLLTEAVARRMQGDVPVGAYISGGLDSALIAAKIVALTPHDEHDSFSVAVADASLSEAKYQHLVVNALNLRHHEYRFTDLDIGPRLSRVIYHCECPIKELYDTAAFALSGLVREHNIKVILGGQGADELFGGYIGYRFDAFQDKRTFPSEMGEMEAKIRRCLWGDHTFLYEKNQDAFLQLKACLYSEVVREELGELGCLAEPVIDQERIRGLHPVHRRSYVDFKLRLSDHLLADHGDRMSFANSVEARYPFLDQEFVTFVTTVPPSLKLNGYEEKYALKRLGERYVPREIVAREKFGFAVPGSQVLLRWNAQYIHELLSPERIAREGYFDPQVVSALLQRYQQPNFRLNVPFDDDLLATIITFGLLLEAFDLPHL